MGAFFPRKRKPRRARSVLRQGSLLALLLATTCGTAWAHNPIVIDGGPTDAATAYEVADISVSRVAYHHAKPGQAFLWLTFEGKAGQTLELQMGVPELDRYAHVRPATAVLGPGLPPAPDLPFAVPQGMGATVLFTENEQPTVFHEEFTGTVSWMFAKNSVPLPQNGKYYMVTYLPSGAEGKFWVAPGDAETFGLWDLIRMPVIVVQARGFHEVFPWGGILGWAYLLIVALLLGGLVGLAFLLRWAVRKSVRHKTRCCAGQSR